MTRPTAGAPGRRHAPLLFFGPFAVVFLAFFVVPIGYAVWQSFTGVRRSGPLGLSESETTFAGLSNYADALTQTGFTESLLRILLFGVVTVPLMIFAAVVLALLLDSAAAVWPRFFRTVYFLPYGIPGVIASILWSYLYLPELSPILEVLQKAGVTVEPLAGDSVLWAIANIVLWEFAGYNMLIIVAQLQAAPRELYDAARVDGANAWQLTWYLKLPLIRPAVVLATVFTIIGTVQLFAEPLVLKRAAPAVTNDYTPNVSAYNQAFTYNDYGLAAAEAVLLALAAFALSFGFLRLAGRGGRPGGGGR
ncbi:sugar ABC transporter permease [Actinomadura sp. KC216]|uniref:carbohydrate ABC transporter permease n=1 Tax=Actinomadura sp. KC216 TaxID=2530370 RepID=UPI00104F12E7|nr:sugar ABC transporter permease [Actinomadura sp. KC216]TDB85986.1 sugar ABC transporter permease [Actinomadura sp. KC216]